MSTVVRDLPLRPGTDRRRRGTPSRLAAGLRGLGDGLRSSFGRGSALQRIHTVHRWVAALAGTVLGLFGLTGLLLAPQLGAGSGVVVLGLFTNPMLSTLSVGVAALLLGAAVRGGPAASTTLVVLGVLFMVSGVGNGFVIGTPLNMLAFQASDVVFSLAAGAALTLLGAHGRFSGGLAPDSPYARRRPEPVVEASPVLGVRDVDPRRAEALVVAERAVARHTATADQRRGVAAAAAHRSPRERLAAFELATSGARAAAPSGS